MTHVYFASKNTRFMYQQRSMLEESYINVIAKATAIAIAPPRKPIAPIRVNVRTSP